MPTIKQIADELHVSKTTVSKVISQLNLTVTRTGNRIELTEEQAQAVKSRITQVSDIQTTQEAPTSEPQIMQIELQNTLMSLLQSQINTLTEQLNVKDTQIAAQQEQIKTLTESLQSTTNALQAAQALHAGTIQASLTAAGEEQQSDTEQDSPPVPESERKKWWARLFN